MASVKALAQSPNLKTLPSDFAHFKNKEKSIEANVPVIDYNLLTSTNPDVRAKAVQDLGRACEEWGYFMVVNHGIPETLTNQLFDASDEFFDLSEEEKEQIRQIQNHPRFPTIIGSGVGPFRGALKKNMACWRDYLMSFVHPEFHFPDKPEHLKDIVPKYAEIARGIARTLLGGISQSLGLEENYIEKATELDSTTQILGLNYYPPCPDPDSAIGITPHTDIGLLTFLLQNGVGGLEILHDGKWMMLNQIPGSLFVSTGDHIEIISNGKYKSVLHRAVVNNSKTRISVVVANGAAPDAVVEPAAPLLHDAPAKYAPMKFMEYVEKKKSSIIYGEKPMLEQLKLY